MQILIPVLALGILALYVAIAWTIIKAYRRTRNVGYLLLGAGLGAGIVITQGVYLFGDLPGWLAASPLSAGETLSLLAFATRLVYGALILSGIALIARGGSAATA